MLKVTQYELHSTAKVWKDFKLAYDLTGHTLSVLTVVAIDGEEFITGQNALCITCLRPTDIGQQALRTTPSSFGSETKL